MKKLTDAQIKNIKEKVESMSLRDKLAQITCISIGRYLGDPKNDMETYKKNIDKLMEEIPVGNIFIGAEIIQEVSGNADRIHEVLEYIQSKSEIPMLVAGDIEYGVGASVGGMTVFPNNMTFAAMDDEKTAYEAGKRTAIEARAVGFNWVFGPVVDLYGNWLGCGNGRMISDDPDMVIKIGKALINGMQDYGLAAAAKHFPDPNYDFRNPHISNVVCDLSEEEWYNTDGRIYKELNENGLISVMSGHVGLTFAEKFNEEEHAYCPATVSKNVIQGILRDKIGFDGVVVTDSMSMGGFTQWKTERERMVGAINAGNDILLFPVAKDFEYLEDAINSGELPMERLNESVERVLRLKTMIGLMDNNEDTYKDIQNILSDNDKFNDFLTKHSITCVRNEDGILPLDKNKIKKVLILKLDRGQKKGPHITFIEELKKMGIETDIYGIEDFADWSHDPEMMQRIAKGEKWDAYFQLYNYAYIGDYRPGALAAQAIWRSSNIDDMKPILISFATPYLLYDIPNAKTFITTFSGKSPKIGTARGMEQV